MFISLKNDVAHIFRCGFLAPFVTGMLLISCQKDDFEYPDSVQIEVGEDFEFDATENQIITVQADCFSFDFEILSITNTLCPEGSRCVFTGYAIISLKSITENGEAITLYYLYEDPGDTSISDHAEFNYDSKNFLIKLQEVKKVYTNENCTQTKNVVVLAIQIL